MAKLTYSFGALSHTIKRENNGIRSKLSKRYLVNKQITPFEGRVYYFKQWLSTQSSYFERNSWQGKII